MVYTYIRRYFCIFLLFNIFSVVAQNYSRQDSLRGDLTIQRSCYDVHFYDLFVLIDDQDLSIESSYNEIYFQARNDFNYFQIDLSLNMQIQKIEFEGDTLSFDREYNAVNVYFPRDISYGERSSIKVWYSGYPTEAKNPPWDGGFSWENDKNGNPWIGVSCQGLGASVWWPCKDHQSDEPDSMRITCATRYPWKIISNGNLRKDTTEWNNFLGSWINKAEWFVSYPINNYNVSIYIGDYINFSDEYISSNDTLNLDYYVLSYNENKARSHFKQIKPMLSCFENYFGKYPFWNDGYALVETPYLGMEHQSAIAYGNNYLPGYYGNTDYIDGLDFDFIILHETGHEWWGNSITTNDIADMWVHEGFCTYSEALYVECMYGYEAMLSYVNNQKRNIKNDKPILGDYNVNKMGSTDMYSKGSLILHTLRNLISNDDLWFKIIKDITDDFKYQNINSADIVSYINQKTENNYDLFFKQYLEDKNIPELQYKLQKQGKNYTLLYRWKAIQDFNMPILINIGGVSDQWIKPNSIWQELNLGSFDEYNFKVRDDLFLITVKKM